ncbi:MAG: acyltransferase family protein [Pyrinomonadaceae bacterium]
MALQHIKALDGVRGIAILLVILFHYGYLGCGWMGVQLFFVLSGYLITSILLQERRQPLKLYLKRFYWRRSLRIFPLYFAYLLVLALAFGLLRVPPAFKDQWPYLFTYTYNIRHILPNYDGSLLLIHLWSLSVEEQFYLIWPLLVYLIAPRHFNKALVGILVGVPLVRLALTCLLFGLGKDALYSATVMYTQTPCQIDAFATGALIASVQFGLIKRPRLLFFSAAALVLLTGLVSQYTSPVVASDRANSFGYPIHLLHHYQFVWGYMLLNFIFGLLILLVVQGRAPLPWLEKHALAFIGKISYGVYIFHYGVLAIFQKFWPVPDRSMASLLLFGPYLAATLFISYLSFRFFEAKFLKLKDRSFARAQPAADPALPLDTAAPAK